MDSVALVQGGKFISEQSRDSGNTHSRTQTPETHTRVRRLRKHTLAYAETPETHSRTHMQHYFHKKIEMIISINNWKIIYRDKNKIWFFPHNIYKSQLQMD